MAVPHFILIEGHTKRVGDHSAEAQILAQMLFERYVQVLETRLATLERLIQQVHAMPACTVIICLSFRFGSTRRKTR